MVVNQNEELTSNIISYLRFPLTIGVVFIHNDLAKNGLSIHGVQYGLNCPDWYYYIITFFSDVLPRLCVPMFFFFSGFLFFYHTDFNTNVYKKKIRSRIKTLLVPYLLWNVIAIVLNFVYKLPFLSSVFPNASHIDFSVARFFNTFFANNNNRGIFVSPITDPLDNIGSNYYPIDFPLWFVRDLMVMVLISPIIYWFIKRTGKWFLIAMGGVYYFYQAAFMPHGGWSVQLSQAVFFFSWGAFYSIMKTNFVSCLRSCKFAPFFYFPIALIDTITKETYYNLFIHEAGIILGVISIIVVVSCFLEKTKFSIDKNLSNSSFFVFALHALFMNNLAKFLFVAIHIPDNPYALLILYFFVPLLTIVICYAIYMLSKKYIPSISDLLTGGR